MYHCQYFEGTQIVFIFFISNSSTCNLTLANYFVTFIINERLHEYNLIFY